MTTIPRTDDPTLTYTGTYDAWNRLVKLTDPSSSNPVQENVYDGRGYRIIRKTYSGGVLDETRHFYFTESWQVLEERLGTSPSTALPDRNFVWGVRYIDDLIMRDRTTTSTLDERLYATQDANWNVTSVVDLIGAVQQRFAYQAYGQDTILDASFAPTSSALEWEYRFAGYRIDLWTAAYIVRNRFYSHRVGSWLNRDPAGYAARQANLYAYIFLRPTVHVDPSGLGGWTRFVGFMKWVGGSFTMVGGGALVAGGAVSEGGTLGASSAVSVPAMVGGAAVASFGFDLSQSGFRQMWTGEHVQSMTSKLGEATLKSIGADPGIARAGGEALEGVGSLMTAGPATSALVARNLETVDGMVIVYRGVSCDEARRLAQTGTLLARGGSNASAPTTVGRFAHSITYQDPRHFWQIPWRGSPYSSVTSSPYWGNYFAGRGGQTLRLAMPKSNLGYSFNPLQGEFLPLGGTSVKVLGLAGTGERASNIVRGINVAGVGQQLGGIFQMADSLSGGQMGISAPSPIDVQANQWFQDNIGEPTSGNVGALFSTPMRVVFED